MGPPDVSKLKSEIAVLEGILREKKEQLRIAEAIEKQKTICGESMWQSLTIRRRNQVWKMMRYEKLVQLIWTSSRIPVDLTKYDGRLAAEEMKRIEKQVWTPRHEGTGKPVFF